MKQIPAPVIDVLITAVVAAGIAIAIAAKQEAGAKEPDAFAYVLGVAIAAPLLLRRRWPLAVLVLTAVALMTYHAFEYPAIGLAVPLAAALFVAASAGYAKQAVALAAGLELLAIGYRDVIKGQSLVSVVGSQTLVEVSLIAAVVLLAETLRSRRALAVEVQERLRRTELDREREAERRVREERLRIAREMHDVLAHTVAVIGIQAGVASEALAESPDQAEAPLRAIREESRQAMAEIRSAVGALRDEEDGAPRTPAPGLAQLDGLVDWAAAADVKLDVSVLGTTRPLPAVVDLAAYRIVQESLTNVVRHADARLAKVTIRYHREAVVVQVDDNGDGAGHEPTASGGHGLAGMRERAAAIGGRLDAGPVPPPGRGFRIRAWLPTERRAA